VNNRCAVLARPHARLLARGSASCTQPASHSWEPERVVSGGDTSYHEMPLRGTMRRRRLDTLQTPNCKTPAPETWVCCRGQPRGRAMARPSSCAAACCSHRESAMGAMAWSCHDGAAAAASHWPAPARYVLAQVLEIWAFRTRSVWPPPLTVSVS